MNIITLEEAQARLPDLIARLQPGEEVVINQAGKPVAKLVRSERQLWPCQPGSAKHIPHRMADDFNAPPDDFREYME